MTLDNIKTLLYKTQNLMYGFNYEVILGIEIYKSCFSLSDVNKAIKSTFPNSIPEEVTPIIISTKDFWEEINYAFDYRGNNMGAVLKLNEKQERDLKNKQSEIKGFVEQYIQAETQIYSYPFLEGIPGYPVFWEYTFVILSSDGNCVLFYGSSSD